ncbi:MAG TPA: sugar ABC transporter ATP-binding protein, partial [Spirochaetia bacterium]|nr:sugar ABC transporter ATP-binding protein [Spirochaetia bacterium]
VVYQDLSLVPNLSVAENIFARRQPVRAATLIDWDRLHARTTELLALFGSEKLDPRTLVRDLSIAKRQVVEILKAMSVNPKILVLDEPTSSLTEVETRELFQNVRTLKARGISVIYISHHLAEIFEIADTVTILRDGRRVCDANVGDIDEDFLVTNMVGRTISNMYGEPAARAAASTDPAAREPAPPAVFEAHGLGRAPWFHDISFRVGRGEIVGFAGLVGSGRTELGRAIFGAEPAESGQMTLAGRPFAARTPRQAMRAGVGYLTEDRKSQGLFLDFTIKANVVSNHLQDFTARALDFLQGRRMDEFARRSIGEFRIVARGPGQVVNHLSGGNQQKVLIGTWFGIQPDFLIVDEPTRGVDVGAKSDIYQLLRGLAARGTAIMLISSDLPEVIGLSDRVYVMRDGGIAGELPRSAAAEETIISMATGLKLTRTKEYSG